MRSPGSGVSTVLSAELSFIAALRAFATHPAARGLGDDVALIETDGARLIITQDTLVEAVHYRPDDPPESVAWKLVAVNISDMAAKGGAPRYAMLSFMLGDDLVWEARFAAGLGDALAFYDVALIGGDTVSGKGRTLSLTLIGEARGTVPGRGGAQVGDALYVSGTIGDSGAGLATLRADPAAEGSLVNAYQRPMPHLAAGQALAPVVSAMMDVSDGLLIDARRIAGASGLAAMIDLDAIPLSAAYRALYGDSREARLRAACAGDDYQLLFTCTLPLPALAIPVTRIGRMIRGDGVQLSDRDGSVPLPETLGWLHGLP